MNDYDKSDERLWWCWYWRQHRGPCHEADGGDDADDGGGQVERPDHLALDLSNDVVEDVMAMLMMMVMLLMMTMTMTMTMMMSSAITMVPVFNDAQAQQFANFGSATILWANVWKFKSKINWDAVCSSRVTTSCSYIVFKEPPLSGHGNSIPSDLFSF